MLHRPYPKLHIQIFYNLNLWDIAAGIVLVKEAGGLLNEIDLSVNKNIKVIASSADINSKLLEKLSNF